MVCGSLEEMPEKSWVARLQSGLAALVAFSGVLMVNSCMSPLELCQISHGELFHWHFI